MIKNIIFVVLALFLTPAYAIEISGAEPQDRSGSSERYIRGDLISFDRDQRLLKTSVGEYTLPSAVNITDRRSDSEQPAKASLRFSGDILLGVTLYN